MSCIFRVSYMTQTYLGHVIYTRLLWYKRTHAIMNTQQGRVLQVCLMLVVYFSSYENYQRVNTDRVRLDL